jgi:hypothetical protein
MLVNMSKKTSQSGIDASIEVSPGLWIADVLQMFFGNAKYVTGEDYLQGFYHGGNEGVSSPWP